MSRMIFGGALGLALAFVLGCGSKPAPQTAPAPEEAKKDPDPGPAPKNEPPKVEPPKGPAKIVWEMDPAKHVVPDAPVRGRIAGTEVTPEVFMTAEELTFRTLKPGTQVAERSVSLKLAPRVPGQPAPPPAPGRTWKVKPDEPPGPNVPVIWIETPGKPILVPAFGYALTLELGPRKNGKVTGKVYLCMPAEDQTELAGTFTTEYWRLPMEPPGADDAPFITGDVTLAGAAPDTKVRVGYAAFQMGGHVQFTESVIAPGRYEHTRLEPGRYLVMAALGDGLATWKWVELPANGMVTENLALDVVKAGGIEVTAPADAKGQVLLAPADDPGKPPLEDAVFKGFSLLVVRTSAEVVAGKAVLKNLGPGKYEVRLGDERRVVEVLPGKTAEVNMTPAKK